MSDDLYGELFAVVCAKRMNVNTSLGKEEALTDAIMQVVDRRIAEATKKLAVVQLLIDAAGTDTATKVFIFDKIHTALTVEWEGGSHE